MTQLATRPEVVELAQLMHLENIVYCSRQDRIVVALQWADLSPFAQGQMFALADCARQYAALDRLPIEAIDIPVPVPAPPPFLGRLAARAEAAILDRTVWIWLFTAFTLGRLL